MSVVEVGDTAMIETELTQEDIETFAALSGDSNPLHLDEEYAATTRFDGRIAHGILTASVISAAMTELPGSAIYLRQDLRFENPVYPGDIVRGEVEVVSREGEDRFRVDTKAFIIEDDERTTRVINGEGEILSIADDIS
ncbi:MAG: acyl dehydratase [uncultured archaeon A07HR60]|jgi:3-hydroxybutyryl-CoA dehydratase|nr:MAG: acyl dehydratase [Halorubrum sp. J07HR59]ESS10824.1 MAG: acyl dehydratase [uncultured archaeon A07HR60]